MPPETQTPLNKKLPQWAIYLTEFLGIVACILVATYAFIYWDGKNNKEEFIQTVVSPDPTANWKTYRNEEYGFEFKYPSDFKIWNISKPSVDQPFNIAINSDTNLVNWSLDVFIPQPSYYADDLIEKQSEQNISGKVCKSIETKIINTNKEQVFICRNGSYDYLIRYDIDNSSPIDPKKLDQIYKKILSTFKFIHSTGSGQVSTSTPN